jgi:hypothetical protein
MIARVSVPLLVAGLLCALCRGQEKPSWQDIAPSSVKVPGGTLYYEDSLSGQVEALKAAYEGFRKRQAGIQAEVRKLRENRAGLAVEVNAIVGLAPDGEAKAKQEEALAQLLKGFPELDLDKDTRLVVVQRTTSKDYLRKGGSLPGFTYNKAREEVSYTLEFLTSPADTGPDEPGETKDHPARAIILPVGEPAAAAEDFRLILSFVSDATERQAGSAIQAFVTGTILTRLKPIDPYFRWFSSGFPNAITARLLRKHLGEKAATKYAAEWDTAPFADLEKQLNLSYWMGAGYCIELPMESEKRLTKARYAYATAEADRLIEAHGLDCVKQILDQVANIRIDSRKLYAAVQKATGEDLEERFKRYGPFPDAETAVARSAETYNAAVDRKDYATALPLMMRILELKGLGDPTFYSNAAFLLFRIGQEELGDQSILRHAAQCKAMGFTTGYIIMHKIFIDYARKCRRLRKAIPSAQIVMEADPVHVPAMVVIMLKANEDGDKEKVRTLGRQVLELEKDPKNPWRQMAELGLRAAGEE